MGPHVNAQALVGILVEAARGAAGGPRGRGATIEGIGQALGFDMGRSVGTYIRPMLVHAFDSPVASIPRWERPCP